MKVSHHLGLTPLLNLSTCTSVFVILLIFSQVYSLRPRPVGHRVTTHGAINLSPRRRPLGSPRLVTKGQPEPGSKGSETDESKKKITIVSEMLENPTLTNRHERLTRSWGACHACRSPPRNKNPQTKKVSFNPVPTVINGPNNAKPPLRPSPKPVPDLLEISFDNVTSQRPEEILRDLRSSGTMGLRSSMKDSYQKFLEHSLDVCLMRLMTLLEHEYNPFNDPSCKSHFSDIRYRRLVERYLARARKEFGDNPFKMDPSKIYKHHEAHPPVGIQHCNADKGQQHIPKTPQPIKVPSPTPSKSPRAVLYIMALLLTIFVIGACLYMVLVAFAL